MVKGHDHGHGLQTVEVLEVSTGVAALEDKRGDCRRKVKCTSRAKQSRSIVWPAFRKYIAKPKVSEVEVNLKHDMSGMLEIAVSG